MASTEKLKTCRAEAKARACWSCCARRRSLTWVAAEYGVRPSQPPRWPRTAVEQLPALFAGESAAQPQLAEQAAPSEALQACLLEHYLR
jgi:hypothetical protein